MCRRGRCRRYGRRRPGRWRSGGGFRPGCLLPNRDGSGQAARQEAGAPDVCRRGDAAHCVLHRSHGLDAGRCAGGGRGAVRWAGRRGGEVRAPASPDKQSYLRSLGIRHVFNSRTLDFAAQVRAATDGRGVDVVLNSLTSGEFISRTLTTLAAGGRFVEISKRGIWTAEQMAATRPDVRYHVLALDELLLRTPQA